MSSYKIDGNHDVIFSKDMTIAELIDANYHLLSIFERLDMQFPFGDVSVGELCAKYNMSANIFLKICRLYATPDSDVTAEELSVEDLAPVVKFLRASHRYYLDVVLPRVEAGVESVLELCDLRQQLLLRRFYNDYAAEIKEHLAYEENVMFPYVESLLAHESLKDLMTEKFLSNHTDICEKIDDMKSIVVKYLPEKCSTQLRCGLLYNIYDMSEDLARHTLVETHLLAPLAKIAEEEYKG